MSKTANPKWLKIRVHCPESVLEPVADLFGVLSGSGVELEPVQEGKCFISGFFQLNQKHNKESIVSRLEQEMSDLFALYSKPAPLLTCSFFDDEDWATSWQQFFKPFPIIPGLIIKPSWEPYQQKQSEQIIEMDPGMAFGTGKHASTQLALRLIHECFQKSPPQSILDVGTGTGILAMATALFGAEQIVAIDNDPEAVRVCVENISHNGLENQITASVTDLAVIEGHVDLLCANIVHNVLVMMLPDFSRLLVNGSQLILAGVLLGDQEKNIIDLAEKKELIVQKVIYEEEWAGLLFEKM